LTLSIVMFRCAFADGNDPVCSMPALSSALPVSSMPVCP